MATALASTVGVGNIAGVATAISIGGPGALFWLWVSGRARHVHQVRRDRHRHSLPRAGCDRADARRRDVRPAQGPRPALARHHLRRPGRARGVRHRQHGAVQFGGVEPAGVVRRATRRSPASCSPSSRQSVILGGIKRIGQFTEYLVPFMALFYSPAACSSWCASPSEIPGALSLVMSSAFSGAAATGGFAGSTVMLAMRYGIARGLFSNEAGLGSAPLVHAAARTDHPVRRACTASSRSSSTPSSSAPRPAW